MKIVSCALLPIMVGFGVSMAQAYAIDGPRSEIEYVSLDQENSTVFEGNKTRSGPTFAPLDSWPVFSTKNVTSKPGVSCLHIASPLEGEDLAVKRPIKETEEFSCGKSNFKILKCLNGCKMALIRRSFTARSAVGRFIISSVYLVDNCRGIVALSVADDYPYNIPLSVPVLTTFRGVLAHGDFPNCPK